MTHPLIPRVEWTVLRTDITFPLASGLVGLASMIRVLATSKGVVAAAAIPPIIHKSNVSWVIR